MPTMEHASPASRIAHVRPATVADLSRVAELLVFTKRVAYRHIFRDDVGSFVDLQVLPVAESFRDGERDLRDVLVYDDGVVKGMLSRTFAADAAELNELYVEPCFQGQGVGCALLAAFLAEAHAAGTARVTLWVVRDNLSARRFYEARGFVPTGEERLIEGTQVGEIRLYRG